MYCKIFKKKEKWVHSTLKGTVSLEFVSVFSLNEFLLVSSHMPRKDFEFYRIFVELFVFVIDPLPPGEQPAMSRDSPVICHR